MSDVADFNANFDPGVAIVRLQEQVARLEEQVAVLEGLVDPVELAAAQRLRSRHLTNEQLRNWSHDQIIPAGAADAQEERPW